MALRDQPYLALYVQDFMTDEKLIECSAASTGVYIRLLCIMHKNEPYGKILLKQKYKQTDKQIKNFALQVARQLPYSFDEILLSLTELVNENVLQIEGDLLVQKRMVRDAEISLVRSKSGRLGGVKSQKNREHFAKAKIEANAQANTEYEIENEIEYKSDKESKEGTGWEENKTDKSDRKPKVDKYPYDQIIFLYHEICTSLPRVEVLSDKRKSAIANCLDKAKPEHLEDYVRGYFQKIQASDFLCGNKTDFRASFDFIFKLSNFYKILEGNYDNITNTNNSNGTGWNSQAGRQDRVNSRLEDLRILAEQRARRNGNSSAFN